METNTTNQMPPQNYLVWAILSTILCCVPFGVVAIINATKVNDYWVAGNHEMAMRASQDAKKWTLWAVFTSVAVWGIYLLLILAIGLLGMEY